MVPGRPRVYIGYQQPLASLISDQGYGRRIPRSVLELDTMLQAIR